MTLLLLSIPLMLVAITMAIVPLAVAMRREAALDVATAAPVAVEGAAPAEEALLAA